MKHERKLTLTKGEATHINRLLSTSGALGLDDTIIYTVFFDADIEMDIKLCGADEDVPWTEAVLFQNGCEVGCTDVHDAYLGEWCIEFDNDEYVVFVDVESTDIPRRDREIEQLWDALEDVPVYEDVDGRLCLDVDWHLWHKGTNVEETWRWFDEHHSRGVGWLMNEYERR